MPEVCLNSEGIPTPVLRPNQPKKVGEGAKPMSTNQVTNSSPPWSISFSILDLKAQAVRLPVSKGAQILLSELLTWSGERGYCWWGTPAIAKDLNWSVSVVWRKATELKQAGLLEVIPRPGRSNYWVPLPGKTKMERLRSELTPLAESRGPFLKKNEKPKRCTVEKSCASTDQAPPSPSNVNAVKMSPKDPTTQEQHSVPGKEHADTSHPKPKANLTPHQWLLIQDIEQECRDFHSRGNFINLVRRHDEEVIRTALSVTREKIALESGVNAGAYFYRTVQSITGDRDIPAHHEPEPTGRTHQAPRSLDFIASPMFAEPEPEPCDPEALKRGWRIHCRAAGVRAMLSLVQKCVPVSVDVGRLWVDVRETFTGMEASILIDRFLDTVVTRMKHAEKMAEAAA
jgi:hypothetical protein